MNVQLFFTAEQIAAANEIGSSFCSLVRQLCQMRRQLQNLGQMSELSENGLVLGLSFGENNIGKFAIDAAALLQIFVIKFHAPFFQSSLHVRGGNCIHACCLGEQIVQLLPAIFCRLAAEHFREKTTLF